MCHCWVEYTMATNFLCFCFSSQDEFVKIMKTYSKWSWRRRFGRFVESSTTSVEQYQLRRRRNVCRRDSSSNSSSRWSSSFPRCRHFVLHRLSPLDRRSAENWLTPLTASGWSCVMRWCGSAPSRQQARLLLLRRWRRQRSRRVQLVFDATSTYSTEDDD